MLGGERQTDSSHAASVIGCGCQKGDSNTGAAGFGGDEKVVQDKGAGQAGGRKAGVELGEATGDAVHERQENDGLVVVKAGTQEFTRTVGVGRLPVELAVGIEEGNEDIQIAESSLADFGRGHLVEVEFAEFLAEVGVGFRLFEEFVEFAIEDLALVLFGGEGFLKDLFAAAGFAFELLDGGGEVFDGAGFDGLFV